MSMGERIRFIRNLRGMTQKYLGVAAGLGEKTADVRMAQYEAGTRTPKEKFTEALAHVLGVSPMALDIPEIEDHLGLMHTLFALEDLYGLHGEKDSDGVCLRLDTERAKEYVTIYPLLAAWAEQREKYKNGEITKEEYDQWRYKYPEFDKTGRWIKVPSEKVSDLLVKALKK